jgi:hypothetical protein
MKTTAGSLAKKGLVAGAVLILLVAAAGIKFAADSRARARQGRASAAAARFPGHRPLGLDFYTHRPIGKTPKGLPWITDLLVVDLDGDGLKDILVCDGRLNRVSWIRQVRLGVFEEQDIGEPVAGPAHLEVADLRGTGHLDVLVSSMGIVPPDNEKIGSVVVLENDGHNHFTNRVLLENVARVTYVKAAHLTHSGRLDLVVGQFGYIEGEVQLDGEPRQLEIQAATRSSTSRAPIHAPVADLLGDGNLDIVALVTHNTEEIHAFFERRPGALPRPGPLRIHQPGLRPAAASCIADVNKDGRPDIVYTNGDGFDYATPGSRPWHGVQWLENKGKAASSPSTGSGDFPGRLQPCRGRPHRRRATWTSSPAAASTTGDKPDAVSLMCLRERRRGQFHSSDLWRTNPPT